MIDTMPMHFTVAQVRAMYPVAPIIRWDRAGKCWLVFHSVEAAWGHATTEAPKVVPVSRPVVMKRNW